MPLIVSIISRLAMLAMLLLPIGARAYDFSKTVSGTTFYFSIIDEVDPAVAVVSPVEFSEDSVERPSFPSGRVTIPSEVVYDGVVYKVAVINNRAFAECRDITSVTIPRWVTSICSDAFRNCTHLYSIVFACDSLLSLDNAFEGCLALDTVVVESNVQILPPFAFNGLNRLKVFVFNAEYPSGMQNLFFDNISPTKVVVGAKVSTIPDFLFYNFVGMKELEYVDEGRSVETIGQCAFVNCSSLSEMVIPDGVRSIGDYAFSYCKLQSVVFCSQLPPYVSKRTFYGLDNSTPVTVPCGTLGVYANSAIGKHFDYLHYSKGCTSSQVGPEIVFVHDTVYIHDTVYQYITELAEKEEEELGEPIAVPDISFLPDEPSEWLFIDGKILRVTNALRLAGTTIRLYDPDGLLVVDDQIPYSQPADNYYVRLPKRKRYFLVIGKYPPVSVDVVNQKVNAR